MKPRNVYKFGRAFAVLLACLGAAIGSSHANGLDAAVADLNAGRYAEARARFLEMAKQGDSEAQLLLGIIYNEARGIPRDIHMARHWFQRAAQQGDSDAQFLLGISYIDRHTDKQDSERARYWIKRAAHNNNRIAQRFLIRAYEQGWFGAAPNLQYAEYWHERSAAVNAR